MKPIVLDLSSPTPLFYAVFQLPILVAIALQMSMWTSFVSVPFFNNSSYKDDLLVKASGIGMSIAMPFTGVISNKMKLSSLHFGSLVAFGAMVLLETPSFFFVGDNVNIGATLFLVTNFLAGAAGAGVLTACVMAECELRSFSDRAFALSLSLGAFNLCQAAGEGVGYAFSRLDPSPALGTGPLYIMPLIVLVFTLLALWSFFWYRRTLLASGASLFASRPDIIPEHKGVLALFCLAGLFYVAGVVLAEQVLGVLVAYVLLGAAVAALVAAFVLRKRVHWLIDQNLLIPRKRLKILPLLATFTTPFAANVGITLQASLSKPSAVCLANDAPKTSLLIARCVSKASFGVGILGAGTLWLTAFRISRQFLLLTGLAAIVCVPLVWVSEWFELGARGTIVAATVLDAATFLSAGFFTLLVFARALPPFRYRESGIAACASLSAILVAQIISSTFRQVVFMLDLARDEQCFNNMASSLLLVGLIACFISSLCLALVPLKGNA
eukprot:gnl/Chilomastix_cuspidata/5722.p1 GENE.gnl/Chilomastix_cuspidata/5722~~gnl/Chilomastix_cuspidata/5722.p1  ORF type:complete len:498 (+),score=195.68 gnl/Chilomastix_cuspidata/5722:141-1634(+)